MPAPTETTMPAAAPINLTRGSVLNLLGEGVPMLVSLVALRILVRHLHDERFALLTLVWTVMAYFGFADLGIGRAITQGVARRLAGGEPGLAGNLVATGLVLVAPLGIAAALALALLTPALVRSLRVPAELVPEALAAFHVLALSLPFFLITAALRGVLEALGRFGLLAGVKCLTGTLVLIAPLLVLPFSVRLGPIVAAAVAVRILSSFLHGAACVHAARSLLRAPRITRAAARELFHFGRWLTADNVVSPVLVYIDRWLLPRFVPFAALAWYATPTDLVLRLLFVPMAIAAVLFPAFAAGFAGPGQAPAITLDRGSRLLAAALFPLALLLVALAPEAIGAWLGPEWSAHAAPVLQWAAVTLFVGGMALAPAALVQAAGRPDIPFAFHCIEVPLHAVAIILLARQWGIVGAAAAFAVRVAVDFCLLAMAVRRLDRGDPRIARTLVRSLAGTALLAGCLIALSLVGPLAARLALLAVALPAFACFAWAKLVHREEAAWLWSRLNPFPLRGAP